MGLAAPLALAASSLEGVVLTRSRAPRDAGSAAMTCADPKDWPSETRENVDCAFRTALAIFLALYFLEVGINSDPPRPRQRHQ